MSGVLDGPVSTAIGNLGEDTKPSEVVVAATVVEGAPLTAPEIVESSPLSYPTVKSVLQDLVEVGLVESRKRETDNRGSNPDEYYPVGKWSKRLGSRNRDVTARVPVAIDDVPPSAKLVAFSLRVNGEQTQKQLVRTTGLSQRTVRQGLIDLGDYVVKRPKLSDARQSLYELEVAGDA